MDKGDRTYAALKRFTEECVHGGDFDQGQSLKDTMSILNKWWNENKQKYQSKSEFLKEKASMEDNDLKAMGIYNKAKKEERIERFEEHWLPKLEIVTDVEKRDNGSFTFYTDDHGVMDFYPKANKLLIRDTNDWKPNGLQWIIDRVIQQV